MGTKWIKAVMTNARGNIISILYKCPYCWEFAQQQFAYCPHCKKKVDKRDE